MALEIALIRGIPGSGKTSIANRLKDFVAISSDDFPGRYIDGVYQPQVNAQSREWCLDQSRKALSKGKNIAVHNTFMLHAYMDQYFELRKEFDCVMYVLTTGGVVQSNGLLAISSHDVPDYQVKKMIAQYEPLIEPEFQGLGLDYLSFLRGIDLELCDQVFIDLDKTLIFPKDGNSFNNDPSNIELNMDLVEALDEAAADVCIFSNQQGVELGKVSQEELIAKFEEILQLLDEQDFNRIVSAYFSIAEKKVLVWTGGVWRTIEVDNIAYKPFSTMFDLHDQFKTGATTSCFIGDAHTKRRNEDYFFAQTIGTTYVPVEAVSFLV